MEASETGEREVNEREERSEATGIGNESPDILLSAFSCPCSVCQRVPVRSVIRIR